MSNANKPALIAYQVTDGKEKSYWSRVGAAWENKSGGYQIRLDSLPLSGEIVLMPPQQQD